MKHFLLMIVLAMVSLMAEAAQARWNSSLSTKKIRHQLSKHASKNAVNLSELSAAIQKVSKKYDLNQMDLVRIVLHESRAEAFATNEASSDHGLMQINSATAMDLGISMECLYNWGCNLEAGARILSNLQNAKDFRICMYNVGRGGVLRKSKTCALYEAKLAKLN